MRVGDVTAKGVANGWGRGAGCTALDLASGAEHQSLRDTLSMLVSSSSRHSRIRALPASRDVDGNALVEDVIRFKLQPNGWLAMRRFRGRDCPVSNKKALMKYLGRIVDNHLADLFRSRSVVQDRATGSLNEPLRSPVNAESVPQELVEILTDSTVPSPFERIAIREEADVVQRRIARIGNPTHRRIAELTGAGLSPREVAEELRVSSNTVSIFLHRFRKDLRAALGWTKRGLA